MNYLKGIFLTTSILSIVVFSACEKNGELLNFSLEDDIELGVLLDTEIQSNPEVYPILSRTQYAAAYAMLDGILSQILESDSVVNKEGFTWAIHILDDDRTINAFTVPGGSLYLYTGMIFLLDREDDLAGLIGHQVAHIDQRHSSKRLQLEFGIPNLLSIVNQERPEVTSDVSTFLASPGLLEFTREEEREADIYTVEYLSDTEYACNGAATFFEKVLAREQSGVDIPFLNAHIRSDDKVADINTIANAVGCNTNHADADGSRMDALQALLRN